MALDPHPLSPGYSWSCGHCQRPGRRRCALPGSGDPHYLYNAEEYPPGRGIIATPDAGINYRQPAELYCRGGVSPHIRCHCEPGRSLVWRPKEVPLGCNPLNGRKPTVTLSDRGILRLPSVAQNDTVYWVIANQAAAWCGNPLKDRDSHASDIGHWLGMTLT